MKAWLITAAALFVPVAGAGGYFVNEWRVCSALEQDFLDTAHDIRRGVRLNATLTELGASRPSRPLDRARELQLAAFERQLEAIYDQCGADAGKAAGRKSEEILWNSPH